MSFTAGDVKKLREMTGAGMMACKEALNTTSGNIDEAVDYLRKKGLAAAAKKQGRVAAEGAVASLVNGNKAVVVEVNSETDFVSKGDDFQNFAKGVATWALENNPADINVLKDARATQVNELTLKCGEKIDIRRYESVELTNPGLIGEYNHGGKIGVLVMLETSAASKPEVQELAKDLAMHVAAADPKFLAATDIDEDFKKREADVYAGQLKEQGKPENMIAKIVEGKLNKLASDVCLLEQKFVKDPDTTVGKLVAATAKTAGADIKVLGFKKLNLGEGIEKKEDNLADEVAKMTGLKN
tara:strand:+ start:671 stop:1567 length:897 start_codon:yes stop_codon:yes gene_type:complete